MTTILSKEPEGLYIQGLQRKLDEHQKDSQFNFKVIEICKKFQGKFLIENNVISLKKVDTSKWNLFRLTSFLSHRFQKNTKFQQTIIKTN